MEEMQKVSKKTMSKEQGDCVSAQSMSKRYAQQKPFLPHVNEVGK